MQGLEEAILVLAMEGKWQKGGGKKQQEPFGRS